MYQTYRWLAGLVVFWLAAFNGAQADNTETTSAFLSDSKVSANIRLRYEHASDDIANDAEALTLRSSLAWQTGPISNNRALTGFMELESTIAIGGADYTDGESDRDTVLIADPPATEFNQLYFSYESPKGWQSKVGRQSISFGDERFVGAVSFRQNHQSFDAISFSRENSDSWSQHYAYVANVNRIFGDESIDRPAGQLGDHKQNSHLFNTTYNGWSAGELEAYAYLIRNQDFQRASTDTHGIRFHGSSRPKRITYLYTGEFARQYSNDENPKNYIANYWRVSGGVSYRRISVQLTQERLGSDNNAGFITPFATVHRFQGWADKFAALTPDEGLVANFVTVAGRWPGFRYRIQYHDFDTDSGSRNVGREFGLHLQHRFKKNYLLELKYADYRAGEGTLQLGGFDTDTRRLFLTVSGKFGEG